MRFLEHRPPIYLILSFLLLILMGTIVLAAFPTADGEYLSLIDALFMSTSATCVTGLSVIDIGTRFTVWGQITILVLIQLGGIGIMTVSTALILALGRTVSFSSRYVVQDVFTHSPQADLYTLLRRVLLFTGSFELAGALFLFLRFEQDFDTPMAVYLAVFHSVSAFCNAGFSLFSDSLTRYRGDLWINLTAITLIVVGGIGFMVLHEASNAWDKRRLGHKYWNQLSLHSKIVMAVSLVLLVGGMLFFLWAEWNNAIKDLPLSEKLLASLFQSVTPRTAGFNTLDYASMSNLTLLVTVMLMFIGASSGSTGGGIKTSTLGVLLALSRARLSGSEHVHAFKRSISSATVNRAFGITVVSMVIVTFGTAALLLSEVGSVPHAESRGRFLEILFESTSAFATVGLSMGITSGLSPLGKLILVAMMFTGRLGPLVIAVVIQPSRKKGTFLYAEERVMIG